MEDPFDFDLQDRGFTLVDDESDQILDGGLSQDASGTVFQESYEIRGSEDRGFLPQRLKLSTGGSIIDKQSLGRRKDTREAAKESLLGTAENRTSESFTGFTIGDFSLQSESEITTAQAIDRGRSERAQAIDDAQRAPVTTNVSKYGKAPDRYDYPGVDTPSATPSLLPEDFIRGGDPDTAPREEVSDSPDFQDSIPEARAGVTNVGRTIEKARATCSVS